MPPVSGYRDERGILTDPFGEPFGEGRFFLKVSNNTADPDPFVDTDSRVLVRSIGICRNIPGELAGPFGSTASNSIANLEIELAQDFSFLVRSPVTVYGENVNATFNGNAFEIEAEDDDDDDDDEGGSYGISTAYDGDGTGNGLNATQDIYNALNSGQYDNIEGQPGLYGEEPSIGDITDDIKNSPDPDANNIFDPEFVYNFAAKVGSVADNHYVGDTQLSGGVELGDDDNPELTVVEGDLKVTGNVEGAVLLVVTGEADFRGDFEFEGLILALGSGVVHLRGDAEIEGGVYVSQVENDDGVMTFGVPTIEVSGDAEIEFSESKIRMALSLLPYKILILREIHPEMDTPLAP